MVKWIKEFFNKPKNDRPKMVAYLDGTGKVEFVIENSPSERLQQSLGNIRQSSNLYLTLFNKK